MSEKITASHVVNFFFEKSEEDGFPLSPLKLIKLVYIAYGWVMAILDRDLFDEEIEAWDFGPVIPSVYHEFKDFGDRSIAGRPSLELKFLEGRRKIAFSKPEISESEVKILSVLNKVWDVYKHFSAWALTDITHKDGTPWSKVHQPGVKNIPLVKDDIREHYKLKIKEYIELAQGA